MKVRSFSQAVQSTGRYIPHEYHEYIYTRILVFISGQMISGPPRKKQDLAKEVFEAAKEYVWFIVSFHLLLFTSQLCRHGAVPLEEVPKETQKSNLFQGSGRIGY